MRIVSKLKIFIWDKLFTPFSIILDFMLGIKLVNAFLQSTKEIDTIRFINILNL